jgi:hypothetical protein
MKHKSKYLVLLLGITCLLLWLMASQGRVQAEICPYSIRISTPKDQVQIGEQVIVDIMLTNTSKQPCETSEDSRPVATHYKIDVTKGNGDSAAKTQRQKTHEDGLVLGSGFLTYTWRPEETRSERITLNELYDLSAPGTYLVRLSNGSALSNLIRFTVSN